MLQRLRHAEIMRRVRTSGATSVRDLASQLGVSPSTIRRDLEVLDRDGTLRRVRGGALPCADADTDRPFAEVAGTDGQDKEAVAARAARLVADGDVVLLDIGTTTMRLARRLRGRRVTVVTSSLAVLDVLRTDPDVELLLLGGMVRRPYHSLVGVLTEAALGQVVADRVFLGASGVRPDGQLVDTTLAEVPLKRAMMAAAGQVVLLVDRHKFPGTGALRVCGPEDIDVLVTNDGADEATLRACTAAGVEVLLA
ncbi:Transcriptional repressor of the fructose operon, DeoR family [[Actinomadura] parvosata subsp. kistnae]|uniref:Lactose phosphotransferase system repressor n=1 Tax=[Actinomadura] parvosata subsp. kistnae TaxID=1909395 RepID=A0A1V0A1V2_9ACTN|nr:DeoR/GlpR family DNA-binding transcription regulator [Nonomuraea sp. ATCC 55076]AQZ64196.1 ArsR family transcriptional regulator [Nonomuraea sp. ATCC 55076]SPM00014.1 Transcriptional repressor of the fructose operon, DeoR family [Actinomadura parvosata subsp. kistnae]